MERLAALVLLALATAGAGPLNDTCPVSGDRADGKVPAIENPPFAIIPKLYCAKADVHTYDDGATKWDFSGRNAFYGPYEYQGR